MEEEESSGEPAPPINFQPSNIDLDPSYDVGDVDIAFDCTISTDGSGSLCNADSGDYEFFRRLQDDGSSVGIFVVNNLSLSESVEVEIRGDIAVALVAQETMVIDGRLFMRPGENGGSPTSGGEVIGNGLGAGEGIEGPVQAGGGAGHCGRGGDHGDGAGGGASYGTPELVPLTGGSSGGERNSGGGGGALHLIAGTSIEVLTTVTVPGGGGADGGGGSGGGILIESPLVTIKGRVAANSGGGAGGDKSDGVDGQDRSNAPASGGGQNTETPGGSGSAADVVDGGAGAATVMTDQEFGSGGGGAGWIRINTESGLADVPGTVTPSFESGCASQGTLG